jgi:magnesium transporter
MRRVFHRIPKEVGLPPGTVAFSGERKIERVRLVVLSYGPDRIEEKEVGSVEECLPYLDGGGITWVSVQGLHETGVLRAIGEKLGLHPLVLEDIVSTGQRPKTEDFQDYLYVVVRMLDYDDAARCVSADQISVILGPGWVLSFQESARDAFEPVRERLRQGRGRSRKLKSDYLAYSLIDAVVDHYFVVLEKLGEQVEALEAELAADPRPDVLRSIHRVRSEMVLVRKSIYPVREVVAGLSRSGSRLIQKETDLFLRDVHDHSVQIIEALESYRDILSGLQELYLSMVSNRLNEIMKILTVGAMIFVPLTFLAGVYGMNFRYFPEIEWRWGYLLFWLVSILLSVCMLIVFRKKKWI